MAGGRVRKVVVCRFCTTCRAAQKQHDDIEPVEAAYAGKLNKELDVKLNADHRCPYRCILTRTDESKVLDMGAIQIAEDQGHEALGSLRKLLLQNSS
ncbi:unnamed protein product [Heligmosomoides polygyrus]|uniref:DUF1450 domain-containing protein n=1 Tax=Heligmosomoides polygyrus TaxID=6339 RepID=A0A183F380_HELPZ|nr:unnamed protein product [Heligmosomoides polygyrus]